MEFVKLKKEVLDDINIDIKNCNEVYYLKDNTNIIGIGLINLKKENIIDFYIKEKYQGNGYGKILFKNLLEKLKEYNLKEITLKIPKDNIKITKIVEDFQGLHISTNKNILEYVIPIQ